MAHHIRAQDVNMALRLPHITQYIAQLRRALNDPSLSKGERARLQKRLDRLVGEVRAHSEGQ